MCECITRVNDAMKPRNARLLLGFTLPAGEEFPLIQTEAIEKKRGFKAPTMFPTFCPFCGVKYEKAPT
jgi:hypothetical protein